MTLLPSGAPNQARTHHRIWPDQARTGSGQIRLDQARLGPDPPRSGQTRLRSDQARSRSGHSRIGQDLAQVQIKPDEADQARSGSCSDHVRSVQIRQGQARSGSQIRRDQARTHHNTLRNNIPNMSGSLVMSYPLKAHYNGTGLKHNSINCFAKSNGFTRNMVIVDTGSFLFFVAASSWLGAFDGCESLVCLGVSTWCASGCG